MDGASTPRNRNRFRGLFIDTPDLDLSWRATSARERSTRSPDQEETVNAAATEAMTTPTPIEERDYAHPEVLVSSEWVGAHLKDENVRVIEADEDVLLYDVGHIPGAVKVDWVADLNDPLTRDYIDHARIQALLRRLGVNQDTTVVLYGDKNNWWATYTFWVFRLFGLENLKIMDGGRARWEQEGRELSQETPSYPQGNITTPERDDSRIRAFRDRVVEHVRARGQLVDVRSPEEYRGERMHMPDYPNEGALRGGHIPGARNVPWGRAVDPDTHTFKPAPELRAIYEEEQKLDPNEPVVAYCRIGERSSHTWFVLTYLLGYPDVRNYDGSWTEWGNAVRMPIER
jgi:thiosulfate/3-mercaptopyruvate sulfurtransferase